MVNEASATVARLGVFDAGVGGFPIAGALQRRFPKASVVYLGDTARRPYGPRPTPEVRRFVAEAEAFFRSEECDLWVVACNTASVAIDLLTGDPPAVDMVTACLRATDPSAAPVGVLATAGTVASGAYVEAFSPRPVYQLATEELLRLAEEGGQETQRVEQLAAEAIETLLENGCEVAVLACTDFTCILPAMVAAAAGRIDLIDPLQAAVDLVSARLASHPPERSDAGPDLLVLTGDSPVPDVAAFASGFGLHLPPPILYPIPA